MCQLFSASPKTDNQNGRGGGEDEIQGGILKLSSLAFIAFTNLDVTKKTQSNYAGAFRRYIQPRLGEKSVEEIQSQDILEALTGLNPQTRYQTLMTLRTILRIGVENGILQENCATKVKPPKLHVKPGKFLTWNELSKIDFGRQTKRIRFLALHGLRYGEAAALEESDIRGGRVYITKSKYGATKSRAGIRSVPHLSEFEKFAIHQNRIADALKPYGVNVHSLRKTYAYILKSANVHVTTASKLLGHSDPALTLRVYTLVRDDETDIAGMAVKGLLGESLVDKGSFDI